MICDNLQLCCEYELKQKPPVRCHNGSRTACIETSDARSAVKCEEKRKKYVMENTRGDFVILYRMDGGIIVKDKSVPEGVKACDYLFVINGEEKVAVVTELKGVNVTKAMRQISGSLELFKDFFKQFSHVYGRAIVTSSVPDLKATPEYVTLNRLIRRSYNGNLKITECQFYEMDVELDKET